MSTYQRLITRLNTTYSDFEKERTALLNNPYILQYLFEHPVHDRDDFVSASAALDLNCMPTYPPCIEASRIDDSFITLMDHRQNYAKDYSRARAYISSLPPNKRPRLRTPYHPRSNPLLERMEDQLDDEAISFTTDFSFRLIEAYTNGAAPKPYNFDYDLNVDLLGCINNRQDGTLYCNMYLFAIIDDTARQQTTLKDYIDQYCLRRMRIHLFRLNHRSTPDDLHRFINRIKEKNRYRSHNHLVLKHPDHAPQPLIIQFHTNYKYNHTTFNKHYKPKVDDFDSTRQFGMDPEPDADTDCQVPRSFLHDLIARRYIPS